MQYANVIVDHKAGFEPLTYAVPAALLAHLQPGSIVTVPLGATSVHGVVVQFVRRVDPQLAVKLKPIKSIVYKGAFVPTYILDAAQSLHQKYSSGLNDTLFTLLPPLLKRIQTEFVPLENQGSGYRTVEYIISAVSRISVYKKIATKLASQNQSLLLLCASQTAAQSLATELAREQLDITLFPHTTKDQRAYFFDAINPAKPGVYIGTRGAVITPLHAIGTVVIDEPWLPGHKEERSPRLWTALIMQELCRSQKIPLYLVSSLPWPETRLLDNPRRYTVKSLFGKVCLTPRRSIKELLTQFLADYDGPKQELALFLRLSQKQTFWCPQCKQTAILYDRCALCGGEPIVLPELSKETITEELNQLHPKANIRIFTSDELLQYHYFDAALVLGFDVFLSIVDFRATTYLVTLLYLLGAQAKETLFVTTHPDEWTRLSQKDNHYFSLEELKTRKEHVLPPFSLAIQVSSEQKAPLTKLMTERQDAILRAGAIKQHDDGYRVSLLLKRGSPIPASWQKRSELKVDILPNYINT